MREQALLPLLLLAAFSCLAPRYSVTSDGGSGNGGSASGSGGSPAGNAAGSSGSSGATSNAGSGGDESGCGVGKKSCAGECVSIDDVTYGCSQTSCNQSQCPAAAASLACEGGACVVATCGTGMKRCDGRCVSISDPSYGCSDTACDATGCPDPQDSTLVCGGGQCMVGACGADTKKCGSNCVPLDATNGCADLQRCTSCDIAEICEGEPKACTCVPDDAEACRGRACGKVRNNCGQLIDCLDSCVEPQTCGGGGLGVNECGCTPDDPCAGKDCGKATNRCGQEVDCTNTCAAPTAACSGNQCVECNAAADCPVATCAKSTCANHKCGFAVAAAGAKCTGGTCSTTKPGICTRPQVSVGSFKIDATEVTRGQYLAFLDAKKNDTTGQPGSCSWNNSYVPTAIWPPTVPDYEQPVTYVDWCDAVAYCTWSGGRLCGKIGGGATPTNAWADPASSQWMRACSGQAGNTFAYGNNYEAGRCNVDEAAPVASFPNCVGGYPGLYDMSGNVQEWEDSCAGGTCSLRGSNYDLGIINGGDRLRCDFGQVDDPTVTHARNGIRCCSSP